MIYCVEDERNIRELLVYTLGSSGYEAKGVANGKELKKALKEEIPDLILLDIMLPGEDGYAVLEYLKGRPDTQDIPVIMVTAKEAEYDKVRGLEGGADDFITKPFGMMEFLARVKAVLRRTKKQEIPREYHYKELTVDMKSRKVWENGRSVDLTLKEFELLRYLLENQGTVLSREKILEKIWGYEIYGETRTVDVHIRTLRQKLGDSGSLIETVRGVGYRIGEET
ncbi:MULTISPECIES: response regulator transcription factor [unclassified Blautia]|uniref:response regulator transcription factor n=1 Tax=unclassified Blautia TaxID=2648079 RepID=UPI000B3868DD|nr:MULTISPECIES: response regulator transcription factor [unclassified Blautia]OUN26762.1 DNA-binding response regulator [Blautia sp. An81]OUN91692.1 DNA-binding response regulator [Blautia sp. An46]